MDTWVRSLSESQITDAAFKEYASRVGMRFRIDETFNDAADMNSIRKFMQGIGDNNPLHLDRNYAGVSVYSGITAPVSWLCSVLPAWILQGLPGVHAVHSETEWTFLRPIREGDIITPESTFTGFEEHESRFGGRTLIEHQEAVYTNQHGDIVARAKPSGYRFERDAAKERKRYEGIRIPHPWTEEELAVIEERILSERPRGAEPLFYECVAEGDDLPVLTKGPLTLSDMIAFCIGADPVGIKAHGSALREYKKHPYWCFRDTVTMGLEPIYSVHYNPVPAQAIGLPAPYDLGTQRQCWQVQMLEYWAGDHAWIKSCYARFRRFVFFSDVIELGGKVIKKYVDDDGTSCVEVETWAMNQRGEDTMPGRAVIALPTESDLISALKDRL